MKLPAISNNVGVIAMAAAIAIVTWIVVITAKVPNPPPPSKAVPAAQTAASPAQPSGNEPGVSYINMNYDKPAASPAPEH